MIMPGKFSSPQDEAVYRIVSDGFADAESGSVADIGEFCASVWVAPDDVDEVGHGYAILREDEQGFVDVDYFDHYGEWSDAWAQVVAEHSFMYGDDD